MDLRMNFVSNRAASPSCETCLRAADFPAHSGEVDDSFPVHATASRQHGFRLRERCFSVNVMTYLTPLCD